MPCLCRNDGQAAESRVAIQVIDLASQNIVKTADAVPGLGQAAAPVPWSRCSDLLCKISDFGEREESGGSGLSQSIGQFYPLPPLCCTVIQLG